MKEHDDRPEVQSLFSNLKGSLPALQELLKRCEDEYEDLVYRFYHQSFKVYRLQDLTLEIVAALQRLAPDRKPNDWFMQIVSAFAFAARIKSRIAHQARIISSMKHFLGPGGAGRQV